MNKFDTGQWEIWIDDVDGELAMKQTDQAMNRISVVEAKVFELLKQENEKMKTAVIGLYNAIKLAPHVNVKLALDFAEEVLELGSPK